VQLLKSRVGVGVGVDVGVGDGDGVAVGVWVGAEVRVAVGVARATAVLGGVREGDSISESREPLARPKRIKARTARMATAARPAFDTTRWRMAEIRKWTFFIASYLVTWGRRMGRSPISSMIPQPAWRTKSQ
jgi:hypothetical protein